jgi:Ser/Thr protein kinase RdoA (MazF antagonist)
MRAKQQVILTGADVDLLRRAYDIGEWLTWDRTPTGYTNHSFFIVASTGKYVLRRSNIHWKTRKDADAMRFEARLIDHLRERGYPAPQVIPTREGDRHFTHQGAFYLMTAFIAGDPCEEGNTAHLLAAGEALGRYHRLVRTLNGPSYAPAPILEPRAISALDRAEHLVAPFLSAVERRHLQDQTSYLRSQFAGIPRALTEGYPALTKQVIHGSFSETCLIFAGDALAGVLDYDRARYEAVATDLAIAIISFCHHKGRDERYWIDLDYARCRDLMAAYLEVNPLPEEELRALPLILRQHSAIKALKRCTNFLWRNSVAPQEEARHRKLAKRLEAGAARLRWLEEHSRELVAAFVDEVDTDRLAKRKSSHDRSVRNTAPSYQTTTRSF